MSSHNPIRNVLQNLADEFRAVNINCLHFNVEINALIEERTEMENKRPLRRICRCLRMVDALKPETSNFFKDRSEDILAMLRHVGVHYDDLKRRYFWALDQLAEATMKLSLLTEEHLKTDAKNRNLGKNWKDFTKYSCSDQEKLEDSPKKRTTGIEKIDKLLGMMLKGSTYQTHKKEMVQPQAGMADKKRKCSARVCTNVTKTPRLTKIEDFPLVDEYESGERSTSTGISKALSKMRKSMKNRKSGKVQIFQDLASASEIKLQIYALMAEIAERDEIIDSLTSQLKIKDAQIAQLVEVIQKENIELEGNFHSRVL